MFCTKKLKPIIFVILLNPLNKLTWAPSKSAILLPRRPISSKGVPFILLMRPRKTCNFGDAGRARIDGCIMYIKDDAKVFLFGKWKKRKTVLGHLRRST